jgi:hypothetical protein
MGWVVPSETVSWACGLANECQSNVTSVVVALGKAKLKPAESFSWINAGTAAPSGEKVTIACWL